MYIFSCLYVYMYTYIYMHFFTSIYKYTSEWVGCPNPLEEKVQMVPKESLDSKHEGSSLFS